MGAWYLFAGVEQFEVELGPGEKEDAGGIAGACALLVLPARVGLWLGLGLGACDAGGDAGAGATASVGDVCVSSAFARVCRKTRRILHNLNNARQSNPPSHWRTADPTATDSKLQKPLVESIAIAKQRIQVFSG